MRLSIMAAISHVYARWVYTSFNMFALYSFGSAWKFLGSKVLFFYISCGLGAALMHTGINYYYFNDAINTLAANGFLRRSSSTFKSGKINTQGVIDLSQYQNF
jgi:hypothetical protein